MNPTEDLWATAQHVARREGFEIAPECEQVLRSELAQAASKIQQSERSREQAIEEARRAVERLVAEMANVATERGLPQLYEQTLYEAMKRLCPFWPFC